MKKLLIAVLMPIAVFAETVRLDIEIKDYDGNPLPGVTIQCASKKRPLIPWARSEYNGMQWTTDKEGKVSESFDCFEGFVHCRFTADGYYPEKIRDIKFRADYDDKTDSMIFSETYKKLEVKLRKIINPQPMIKHRIDKGIMDLPKRHGRFGFDLKVGDWIAPDGKGEIADFYVVYDWVEDEKTISSSGRIEFVDKGCGAYKKKKLLCKKFPVDYSVDKEAEFVSSIPFHSYTIKETWKSDDLVPAAEDEFLVIRSRTSYDENGNMVGAHYTHIQGPIGIGYYFGLGDVYFNPRVNDTNLEYDQGLKPKTHIAPQVNK